MTTVRNDALLDWYATQGRDLPWRTSPDPYPVLISEVMLQQTQVSRVIPKFEEFLNRWPTVEDLGKAPTHDVLSVWSGLGYNSRALRLTEAARIVSSQGWPTSVAGLRSLPGVGPYTAAAIASICFDEAIPAVDTNLRRVLSRWAGEPLDGSDLASYASEVLGEPAGDWNQALMDLGTLHCSPRDPTCSTCPVYDWCSDPSVYEPPQRQSTFEGSHRQLRGAVLRAHLNGEDVHEVGRRLGRSANDVRATYDALRFEGLIPDD